MQKYFFENPLFILLSLDELYILFIIETFKNLIFSMSYKRPLGQTLGYQRSHIGQLRNRRNSKGPSAAKT
jgi:hypothetical protein